MKRLDQIKKIMIFGRPGSGKSYFAQQLHTYTHLPLYHMDNYFFEKNWQEKETLQYLREERDIVQKKKWIIDGNSIHSLEIRYQKAELALYFNFPRWYCLPRVVQRFLENKTRPDRPANCPEKLSWKFLKYLWQFETRLHSKLIKLKTCYPDVVFFEIKSKKALQKFLQTH